MLKVLWGLKSDCKCTISSLTHILKHELHFQNKIKNSLNSNGVLLKADCRL